MAQRKSSPSKTTTKKETAPQKARRKATESARHQTAAVILFATAILVFCVAVIPGESLWKFLHLLLLGLFGVCAYILPIFIGYIAYVCAKERPIGSVSTKLWQTFSLLIMISTAIQIFLLDAKSTGFFGAIRGSYEAGGKNEGGGVLGSLFGWILERLLGDTGAKIVILLLIAVFLMLVTGTTVFALLKTLWKPVKKTKEGLENAMESAVETMEQKRAEKKSPYDVDLGDGYPDGKNAEPAAITEEEQPSMSNEKLEDLKKAIRGVNDAVAIAENEKPKEKAEKPEKAEKSSEETFDAPKEEPKKEETEAYKFPPISLLNESKGADEDDVAREQTATAQLLTRTLQEFGVSAQVVGVSHGPTVTRYELQPNAGVKISRITGLSDDIALRLATSGVRIEAPIPNKAAVGIEVPNKVTNSVCLRELIDSKEFRTAKSRLTVALGKDIGGQIVLTDLSKMPHLLIAGTTGSGKSVCTNSMIQSVLFHARPDEVKLLLVDPKQVEFGVYNGIPHLLVPVVTDPRKAAGALGWAVNEMTRRYKLFAESGARDLTSYNEFAKGDENAQVLPQILIIIDELADLMMVAANEVESNICRLAQMARAAGMHLVIATQRPSVDVITGLIKANIPSRLALTVASAVDSRTILDAGGAEKLLGKGDMLFMPIGFSKPMRVQGCFVGNREIESVVDFLKSVESHEYDEAVIEEIERQAAATEKTATKAVTDAEDEDEAFGDDMFPQAVEVVVEAGMASTSLLQRRLRLGYARAGRLIDEMEQRGIVGPHEGSKPRQVLISKQQWLEMNMLRPDDPTEE